MVNKIDSNFTGLRYTEEDSLGVLSGDEAWHPLEPNSYTDFGAQLATLARNPIQASRQRKKGVVTDLDAKAGFASDFTQKNFYDLMQGFFFADWRVKASTTISAATASSDDFTVADQSDFRSGHLVFVEGLTGLNNSGLLLLNGVTAGALSTTSSLTDETAAGTVKAVGFQFPSGALSVDHISAQVTHYDLTGVAAASKVYTIASGPANNDTVTINGRVYTWKTALTGAADEIKIGADATASGVNMDAAINGSAGAGSIYGTGTVANTLVSATNSTGAVTVTARLPGASGNSITLAESGANTSWAGAATALSGGTGVGFVELGLIPGEWIFVGGDVGGTDKFGTAGNNGWARVFSVADSQLVVDKTEGTTVDEAGGSLTVRIFFGDVIKNESDPDLIVRRSYQLERSLVSAGYEYVIGCVANTLAFQMQTANKITCSLGFISTDSAQVTSGSRKAGTFPAIEESDAFNTSSDFARIRLATKSAYSTPLFAFLSELSFTINNNVSPNKAIGTLGAFDLTAGDFVVDGTMTAYFSDISAVQAVRDNADVSLDFNVVKNNAGWMFDIPLLTLGDGRLNVEKDQPIKIPLSVAAAADQTFDHTLLACSYAYLPSAAE